MDSGVRFRPRLGRWRSSASRYMRTARPCSRPLARASLCSSVMGDFPAFDLGAISPLFSLTPPHFNACCTGRDPDYARPMDPARHRSLGLTDDEEASIRRILGRSPNDLELAMYAVMWSEHCSYKSSRLHLRRLPTEAAWVLVGPGENAGVIDAGDGVAVALRIESHNHPSAIQPSQRAATGAREIL